MKLFLLAHAAGNVWEYEKIFKVLKEVEVIPIELPGNLSRFGDNLPADFMDYVDEAYKIIVGNLQKSEKFSILGHSFGGYITFELARRFDNNCLMHIFISGCVPYHVKMEPLDVSVNCMRYFGYSQIYNEELENLFNPILSKLVNILYEYRQKFTYYNKIDTKATILMGRDDLCSERSQEWIQYFRKTCVDIHIFDGGHFYFKQNSKNLKKLITLVNVRCIEREVQV